MDEKQPNTLLTLKREDMLNERKGLVRAVDTVSAEIAV